MQNQLKIKVCGMRNPQNILEVVNLSPDYMGFIFYDKSKRLVNEETFSVNTSNSERIGVFVNQPTAYILKMIKEKQLNGVQLHGDEIPEMCATLKQNTEVIKAFQLNEKFDFKLLNDYKTSVDYFLFDTKTNSSERGGTGKKFNWTLLKNYTLEVPFFLSGGITLEDVEALKSFSHPKFFCVDVNSGFEDSPSMKNVKKLSTFIQQLRK